MARDGFVTHGELWQELQEVKAKLLALHQLIADLLAAIKEERAADPPADS